MPGESKSWRPAHWSSTKRRRFEDHVYQWAEGWLAYFLGDYNGAMLAAQLRNQRRAKQSLEALRSRGVATIGSTTE